MSLYARIYMFLLGLAVLAFVINQVRTRRLQERYALLWLLAGLGLTIAPLVIPWLDRVAYALGFDYPPALLLLLAVIALLLIIFQLSLTISHNSDQLKALTQEMGLLRQELDALRQAVQAGSDTTTDETVIARRVLCDEAIARVAADGDCFAQTARNDSVAETHR